MLSKNKIKFINSLALKKNRDETALFCAEGAKCVGDLFSAFACHTLIATKEWLAQHLFEAEEVIAVDSVEEIKKISFFKTPSPVFAVFRKPNFALNVQTLENELSLLLDSIQDPGNLGTIVRIADWFGIRNIVCCGATADIFNPKSVQATMGALARVRLHYTEAASFFEQLKSQKIDLPVYGTFLDGATIYHAPLTPNGIIVMGNEGKGISSDVAAHVSQRLFIPNFPQNEPTSESLNVAIATGIVCAEFRRRITTL